MPTDFEPVIQLFSVFGLGGVFYWAWQQSQKKNDAHVERLCNEAQAREKAMVAELHTLQKFTQDTLHTTLLRSAVAQEENSAAKRDLAAAIYALPCRNIRQSDVDSLLNRREGDSQS